MKYTLDKEYFENNPGEIIQFGRGAKMVGKYEISSKTLKDVSKNKLLLEELYKMKKPYIKVESEKKSNKNKKVNDYKKATSKQKEKQVLPKASKE
tara:strand:+ start:3427 stop:3711 length:285 start_codon:yes stop_codon:yes gene_type:complete